MFLLKFDFCHASNYKQLLDEVFVISGIIKGEVRVISRSRRLRLITLTETLIILDIHPALIGKGGDISVTQASYDFSCD